MAGSVSADSGSEGASFLDIPVGGRPTALGNAYSALSADAYAPVANPAGLGFLPSTQFAAMHLSYLESMDYEFASFVHPFRFGQSMGVSVQYLRPGDNIQRDATGTEIGDYSGSFLSGSLSYGQKVNQFAAFGITGKLVQSKIAGYSANGYGADVGGMFYPSHQLILALGVANIGSNLSYINEGDSLPLNIKGGLAYNPIQPLVLALQETYSRSGLASTQLGVEWSPIDMISIRGGYKSETQKELSGWTAGIGLMLAGQEFDYTWVPMKDFGNTQYFSLVLRGGGVASEESKDIPDVAPSKRNRTKNFPDRDDLDQDDQEFAPRDTNYPGLRRMDLR